MRTRAPGGAEVIVVVPIAGLLARRMVCDVPVGDKLSIGGTYGLIWFGSRLDNYRPQERTRWSASGNARLRVKRC
jgi:phosphatidylserine decarboxylase